MAVMCMLEPSKHVQKHGRVGIWAPTARQCQTDIWTFWTIYPKILPGLPSDTNPEKSTLDRTPALVPVFGFSLVFPSFLLLTLGGSRDKPHWTKLPPVRNSDIMTGRILPDLTTCSLAGNSAITTNPILPQSRFQHAGRSRDKFAAAFPPLLKPPQES